MSQAQVQATETKKYRQYFSNRAVITITMATGKGIRFVGGMYITDKQDEIEFLDNEIRLGHPVIFSKKGQEEVTSDALDPLAAIKKKAVEEYLAAQARITDPNTDMGNTVANSGGGIQTTKTIGAITVGSKSK